MSDSVIQPMGSYEGGTTYYKCTGFNQFDNSEIIKDLLKISSDPLEVISDNWTHIPFSSFEYYYTITWDNSTLTLGKDPCLTKIVVRNGVDGNNILAERIIDYVKDVDKNSGVIKVWIDFNDIGGSGDIYLEFCFGIVDIYPEFVVEVETEEAYNNNISSFNPDSIVLLDEQDKLITKNHEFQFVPHVKDSPFFRRYNQLTVDSYGNAIWEDLRNYIYIATPMDDLRASSTIDEVVDYLNTNLSKCYVVVHISEFGKPVNIAVRVRNDFAGARLVGVLGGHAEVDDQGDDHIHFRGECYPVTAEDTNEIVRVDIRLSQTYVPDNPYRIENSSFRKYVLGSSAESGNNVYNLPIDTTTPEGTITDKDVEEIRNAFINNKLFAVTGNNTILYVSGSTILGDYCQFTFSATFIYTIVVIDLNKKTYTISQNYLARFADSNNDHIMEVMSESKYNQVSHRDDTLYFITEDEAVTLEADGTLKVEVPQLENKSSNNEIDNLLRGGIKLDLK